MRRLIRNILREVVKPDDYMYPESSQDIEFLYHSTARRHLESILKNGLIPQKQENGLSRVYFGTYDSVEGLYIQVDYPIMLRIDFSKLDPSLLRPDDVEFADMYGEGWENATWQESLDASGQVAYEGRVPPDAIEVEYL